VSSKASINQDQVANGADKVIALFGAVTDEIDSVVKDIVVEKTGPTNPWPLLIGKYGQTRVLLIQTGVGKRGAEGALEFVLNHYPVLAIICFGFGGGLTPELEVGDLILCQKLLCEASSAAGDAYYSDRYLINMAMQAMEAKRMKVFSANSLTADRLITTPEEKERLAEAYRAQIVDMENYWLAKKASKRNVPFLGVRAISDTSTESLPPLDHFIGPSGERLWQGALRHFLVRPRELIRLPRIYLNSRQARINLTQFFRAFIPHLGSRGVR
jgi:adenosylhomocysteine nucleosidase